MLKRQILLALTFALSLSFAQELRIEVEGHEPAVYTAEALAKLPRASATTANDGIETRYEGVWLHELLSRAGAPAGTALRGKALSSYILAEASDGYQVLYSLAEIDPAFTDRPVLVADTANGKPLFGAMGRFRLVAAAEKRGARSVRMLTKVVVVQLRK